MCASNSSASMRAKASKGVALLTIIGCSALCCSNFGHGIRSRKVESWNTTRRQETEEIQAGHSCQPCRLSGRQTLFLQVMDRCYETHFMQYLFWLLAQRQEQIIREVEKDLGHGFCLSGDARGQETPWLLPESIRERAGCRFIV